MAPATDKVLPKPPLGSCWGGHSTSAAAPVQLQCRGGGWSHLGDVTGWGGQGMEVTTETLRSVNRADSPIPKPFPAL